MGFNFHIILRHKKWNEFHKIPPKGANYDQNNLYINQKQIMSDVIPNPKPWSGGYNNDNIISSDSGHFRKIEICGEFFANI